MTIKQKRGRPRFYTSETIYYPRIRAPGMLLFLRRWVVHDDPFHLFYLLNVPPSNPLSRDVIGGNGCQVQPNISELQVHPGWAAADMRHGLRCDGQ